MKKLLLLLLLLCTFSIVFSQYKTINIPVGKYEIKTRSNTDVIKKWTRSVSASYYYPTVDIELVDTVFYVPADASNDTITTLLTAMNSVPTSLRAAILYERGSDRLTLRSYARNNTYVGSYGTGSKPKFTALDSVTEWTDKGGNIWESTNAVGTLSRLNMVVINGVNTPMGRTPNSGFFTYQSHTGNTSITSTDLVGITDYDSAEVALNVNAWTTEIAAITDHNTGTGAITFTQYEAFTISTDGLSFIIQNDSLTLDAQNEWYYNPTNKKLYIYSTTEPTGVQVSTLEYLTSITSHDSITIKNIVFEGANKQAIKIDGSNHITIDHCDIEYTGLDAIYGGFTTLDTSDSLTVKYCTINESNNGAIGVSTYFSNPIIAHNTITNSGLIYGSTAIYTSGTNTSHLAYGINAKGEGAHIYSNDILNTGYNGIQYRGSNSIIEYNYIDNFCLTLTDGGGIYAYYGDASADLTGIIVRYNLSINGHESNGLYLDDRQNNSLIYGNTFANCELSGAYFHNTWNIVFRDNYLYNNGYGMLLVNNQYASYPLDSVYIKNNTIVAEADQYLMWTDYSENFTRFVSDSNKYVRPVTDDNMFSVRVRTPSDVRSDYDFAQWINYFEQDSASTRFSAYPASSADSIFFVYNTTRTDIDTVVNDYLGIDGTVYSGSITIPALSGFVMMDTTTYEQKLNVGNIEYWQLNSATANNDTLIGDINGYKLTNTSGGAVVGADSVLFDTNTDDLSIAYSASVYPTGNAFSVSAWVNATSLSGSQYIMAYYPGGTDINWYFRTEATGLLRANIRNSDATPIAFSFTTATGLITTGNWYHVTLVQYGVGKKPRIFLNGNIVGEAGSAFSGTLRNTGTNEISVGNLSAAGFGGFFGAIKKLRYMNRALTAGEIYYLSNQ